MQVVFASADDLLDVERLELVDVVAGRGHEADALAVSQPPQQNLGLGDLVDLELFL